MKKKLSIILTICMLVSIMNTFAFEVRKPQDDKLGTYFDQELRDNRYYYTISWGDTERYRLDISEEEARNERILEIVIKNFAMGEMGLVSGGIAFLLSFIMHYAHSPYDRAGTYYIYKTPCQRIQHDRLTGEERIVERGEKIEITHNGMRTGGRTIWN